MNDRFKFRYYSKSEMRYLLNSEIKAIFAMSCLLQDVDDNAQEQAVNVGLSGECEDLYITEQCTGLRDRNGKLIFEGDLLRKIEHDCFCLHDHNDIELMSRLNDDKTLVSSNAASDRGFFYVTFYGKKDVATMDRFPWFWLKEEHFGYEGEGLEQSDDWVIIGNIHERSEL